MRFSLFVHMERWDDQVSHRQLFEDLRGRPLEVPLDHFLFRGRFLRRGGGPLEGLFPPTEAAPPDRAAFV